MLPMFMMFHYLRPGKRKSTADDEVKNEVVSEEKDTKKAKVESDENNEDMETDDKG